MVVRCLISMFEWTSKSSLLRIYENFHNLHVGWLIVMWFPVVENNIILTAVGGRAMWKATALLYIKTQSTKIRTHSCTVHGICHHLQVWHACYSIYVDDIFCIWIKPIKVSGCVSHRVEHHSLHYSIWCLDLKMIILDKKFKLPISSRLLYFRWCNFR